MEEQFSRSCMLVGNEAIEKLKKSRVAVFGAGGVGGYAIEALSRCGIGAIDIIDSDKVCESNINRQIIATHSSIGKYKVDVAEERIKDINPNCEVRTYKMFYLPENASQLDMSCYDYVIDCIDTVTAKIELIKRCKQAGAPIISSMGTANKLDATRFVVADISKTQMDPLARVIRKKMKELGMAGLKVVYSEEPPMKPIAEHYGGKDGMRLPPASISFVPAAAGLIIGGEAIKDIIKE